jgi:hypothetical protein
MRAGLDGVLGQEAEEDAAPDTKKERTKETTPIPAAPPSPQVGGRTRYFVVKSFSARDVALAFERGVWATQPHNEPKLNEAYASCGSGGGGVVLFFSINCLSGDTQIPTLAGLSIPLRSLKQGARIQSFMTPPRPPEGSYPAAPGRTVCPAGITASDAFMRGTTMEKQPAKKVCVDPSAAIAPRPCVKVICADYSELVCTPDHEIFVVRMEEPRTHVQASSTSSGTPTKSSSSLKQTTLESFAKALSAAPSVSEPTAVASQQTNLQRSEPATCLGYFLGMPPGLIFEIFRHLVLDPHALANLMKTSRTMCNAIDTFRPQLFAHLLDHAQFIPAQDLNPRTDFIVSSSMSAVPDNPLEDGGSPEWEIAGLHMPHDRLKIQALGRLMGHVATDGSLGKNIDKLNLGHHFDVM